MKKNLGVIWEISQMFDDWINCEKKWAETVAQTVGVDAQKMAINLKSSFYHIGKYPWLKSAVGAGSTIHLGGLAFLTCRSSLVFFENFIPQIIHDQSFMLIRGSIWNNWEFFV